MPAKKKFALWEEGKFIGEYSCREIANRLFCATEYIRYGKRTGRTLYGKYQITGDRDSPPERPFNPYLGRPPKFIYTLYDEGGNVVDSGMANELSRKYGLNKERIWCSASKHVKLGKYTVTKTANNN